MNLFNFFRQVSKKEDTAKLARDRLQKIVELERAAAIRPDWASHAQVSILEILQKYTNIEMSDLQMEFAMAGEAREMMINIDLPEEDKPSEEDAA